MNQLCYRIDLDEELVKSVRQMKQISIAMLGDPFLNQDSRLAWQAASERWTLMEQELEKKRLAKRGQLPSQQERSEAHDGSR